MKNTERSNTLSHRRGRAGLGLAILIILMLGAFGGGTMDQTSTWSKAPDDPPARAPLVQTLTELQASTGGMVVDRQGNLYVADIGLAPQRNGSSVYKVTPGGETSVFATGLTGPSGNAFDSQGNLFQSNFSSHRVSKITPEGQVSGFAFDGIVAPVGIAIDSEDNLFVTNCGSNTIRKVTAAGVSTPFASSSFFNCPNGITLDEAGTVYVANFSDGRVLKITPDGSVSEFATLPGNNNGHITYGNGVLYVVDRGGHRIYTLDLSGELAVLAGTGQRGHEDGTALEATFSLPNDVAISPTGDTLYVNEVVSLDANVNQPSLVRMILLQETVSTEPDQDLPDGFKLGQNSPNPLKEHTQIPFTLPEPSRVTLTLYDTQGRKLHDLLVDEIRETGPHVVRFSDTMLANGTYLYRLAVQPLSRSGRGFMASRSLTVLK